MAKRRRSEDKDEDGTRHRRAAHRRRRRRGRRLYVVVHDHIEGCAVHKLDVDAFEPADSDSDLDRRAQRFPRRAAVRLASPSQWLISDWFVSTGTNIFAFYQTTNTRTLVYDTETSLVAICPPPVAPKYSPVFLAIGHDVYALDTTGGPHLDPSLEKLGPEPRLGWGQWHWESLPPLPFKRHGAIYLSHAVHPDGSAFFVSVNYAGTFSFDTDRRTWTRHGLWLLPFFGEAYFVRELDAWVGRSSQQRGYLTACQVISPGDVDGDGHRAGPGPACTSVRDRVYDSSSKRHLRASLIYMGDAEFCILETVKREGYDTFTENRPVRMLLRLATFRVERHHGDGELRAVNMRTMIYKWPHRAVQFWDPTAFWI